MINPGPFLFAILLAMKTKKTKKANRPSWDEYFMAIAEAAASRATCDRGRAACVIVRDKHILSTGYVGSPPGLAHCDEVGHELHAVLDDDNTKSMHCVRTTHAEQNAIAQAARRGVSLDGGTIYVGMTPCYTCAKILVTAGIKRVVAAQDYHKGGRSKEIFKDAGIKFDLLNEEIVKYDRQ